MSDLTRRDLLLTTAASGAAILAGSALASAPAAAPATARGSRRLRVAVIGCGGRGTGAAFNALAASPDVEIWALADAFADRLAGSASELEKHHGARATVPADRRFVGLDAFTKALATDCDIAILATPPGFRPAHFAAAVAAGKHVFMEKPVAVDPAGVRTVIAAAKAARERQLSVVSGTQRRHEQCYLNAHKRVVNGAIGPVQSATVYWNQGSLWHHKPRPEWSDAEWQMRNWLYFAWLSGDHIVEQHVHNLDVAAWFMGIGSASDDTDGVMPVSVTAMGGRQVRTAPEFGHVFDHFACVFSYADGREVHSYCRQIEGCTNRVEEVIRGTDGLARLASGRANITGKEPWKHTGDQPDPYTTEHEDLIASITGSGPYRNEGRRIAESTLMAIMGRMSAYTGKAITWEQAMNSKLDLMPPNLAFGPLPVPEVAVPGRTPLI